MKVKFLSIAFTLLFFTQISVAQKKYIEPLLGYQTSIDSTNQKLDFTQINLGAQVRWDKSNKYNFTLQILSSIGITSTSYDSAFTANPTLPLFNAAKKTINPYSISIMTGYHFLVYKFKEHSKLFFVLSAGITYQAIKVRYEYDKTNYTILNPDKSINGWGVAFSFDAEYVYRLNNNNLIFQAGIATPPIVAVKHYPSSFNFLTPVYINVGYSINILKNKNGK